MNASVMSIFRLTFYDEQAHSDLFQTSSIKHKISSPMDFTFAASLRLLADHTTRREDGGKLPTRSTGQGRVRVSAVTQKAPHSSRRGYRAFYGPALETRSAVSFVGVLCGARAIGRLRRGEPRAKRTYACSAVGEGGGSAKTKEREEWERGCNVEGEGACCRGRG